MNPYYNSHFFTATILQWQHLMKHDKYKDIIVESLRFLTQQKRITVYAFVIMPNHIHLIWHIAGGHTLAKVQQSFLKYTAQQIKADLIKNDPALLECFKVNTADRHYQFWERNPLSIDLYNRDIFMQKLNYLHNNPIAEKWRLCNYPEEYKYSSAKFYIDGQDDFGLLSHYEG